jgi:asparagine synthase (glutamine-hydrolysing)
MCGILGVFTADTGHTPDRDRLTEMLEMLIPRGPDHQCVRVQPGLGLGHTRLAILERTEAANQPAGEGAGELCYNGEIYNFSELAADLGDGRLVDAGDTRVLLATLRDRGMRCLRQLDGMFAFAFHDRAEDVLHLVRDPVGQKPLYYAYCQGDLWFASEAKVLRQLPGVGDALNPSAVSTWLAIGATELANGSTLYDGIYALPPGHRLELSRHDLKAWPRPKPTRWYTMRRGETTEAEARGAISASIGRRLIADVPLGALLSGGVDSALLISLIAEQRPLDGLQTFGVGYTDDDADLRWARRVATDLGVEHHEVLLDRDQYLTLLDEATLALGAPLTFGNEPALLALCRKAREHVTVVVGGEGADEAFAGYREPFASPAWRRRAVGFAAGLLGQREKEALAATFGMLPPLGESDFFLNMYHWFSFAERGLLYADDFKKAVGHDEELFAHVDSLYAAAPTSCRLARQQGVFIGDHLPRLLRRLDAMSMSCGLEARAPFCARSVVHAGLSLPAADKLVPHFGQDLSMSQSITGIGGKEVLRRFARDRGLCVATRPKNPFAAPFLAWFTEEHADHWRPQIMEDGGVTRFLDRERLGRWLDQATGVNAGFKIWQLYALARFLKLNGL